MRNGKTKERKTTTGSISPSLLKNVRIVGAHLGIGNAAVLDRFAAPVIEKLVRRLEARKHVDLGVSQAG